MSDRSQAATSGPVVGERGFSGWIAARANRREYWLWLVPIFAVATVLAAFGHPVWSAVSSLPILFVWIRRLHDLGRTGWWAPAINVVCNVTSWIIKFAIAGDTGVMIGGLLPLIAIIALGCIPGQPRKNEFGLPPGRKAKDLAETFS